MPLQRFIARRLGALTKPSTRIPYAWVYHEPDVFMQRTSSLTVAKKYLHRRLRLALSGQANREVRHVAPNARVLWIYGGKASVGDAVMDLSGRALLRDREGPIDLLITPGLKAVFEGDDIFRQVFDDPARLNPADYDVVVLQEFNYPTLRLKRKHFPSLPFACLFRFFHGPDRNQTQFSLAAVNDVFSLGFGPDALLARAKPYLRQESDLPESVVRQLPARPFIVLAMGGVEPRRTYAHWREFLQAYDIAYQPGLPTGVVLLGSGNGVDADIGFRYRRAAALGPDLELVLAQGEGQGPCLQRRGSDQLQVVGHLPAMASPSTRMEGALVAPRNSRSEPGTSLA